MSEPGRSVAFRRDRERSWRRLDSLCHRIESRGMRALNEQELVELPHLHRAALSSLSVARAVSLDRAVLEYLEALTARSHALVYGVRQDLGRAIADFFLRTVPRGVRAARWPLALAAATLATGIVSGFCVVAADLDLYDALVPVDMAQGRDPSASIDDLREVLYGDFDLGDGLATFAAFLFQHNTQVSILCFALGFAVGVPVLWLLWFNGMLLGAMAGLHHARGLSVDFWGWLLPHGISELSAILLCATAGLIQGRAVLLPGRRSRAAALRAAGREAAPLVLFGVVLLLIAALIEGLFRQLVHSLPARYGLAAASAIALAVYLLACGRRAQ